VIVWMGGALVTVPFVTQGCAATRRVGFVCGGWSIAATLGGGLDVPGRSTGCCGLFGRGFIGAFDSLARREEALLHAAGQWNDEICKRLIGSAFENFSGSVVV